MGHKTHVISHLSAGKHASGSVLCKCVMAHSVSNLSTCAYPAKSLYTVFIHISQILFTLYIYLFHAGSNVIQWFDLDIVILFILGKMCVKKKDDYHSVVKQSALKTDLLS